MKNIRNNGSKDDNKGQISCFPSVVGHLFLGKLNDASLETEESPK